MATVVRQAPVIANKFAAFPTLTWLSRVPGAGAHFRKRIE